MRLAYLKLHRAKLQRNARWVRDRSKLVKLHIALSCKVLPIESPAGAGSFAESFDLRDCSVLAFVLPRGVVV